MEIKSDITLTPKQIADALFELDDRQVMQVFEEWYNKVEEEYQKPSKYYKVSFYGFCLYLTRDMTEGAKEVVRGMYSALIYNTCAKPYFDKKNY